MVMEDSNPTGGCVSATCRVASWSTGLSPAVPDLSNLKICGQNSALVNSEMNCNKHCLIWHKSENNSSDVWLNKNGCRLLPVGLRAGIYLNLRLIPATGSFPGYCSEMT